MNILLFKVLDLIFSSFFKMSQNGPLARQKGWILLEIPNRLEIIVIDIEYRKILRNPKILGQFNGSHNGLQRKPCGKKKNTVDTYKYLKIKIQKYNCNAKIMKETIITNNNIMSRNSNNNNIKSNDHKFQVQNLK